MAAKPMYGDSGAAAGEQATGGIAAAGETTATAPGGSAWHEGRRQEKLESEANERYMGIGARGLGGSYGYNTGGHENRRVGADIFKP